MAGVKKAADTANLKQFVNIRAFRETCERLGIPDCEKETPGISADVTDDGTVKASWRSSGGWEPVPRCIIDELEVNGFVIKDGCHVWTVVKP